MAVDIGSIAALAGSLQTAVEITKGLVGLRDTAVIQNKIIELQGVILSAQSNALMAQQDQFTLLDRVRELEERLTRMEEWNAEKQKCELKEVDRGAFAYVLRPSGSGSEPLHWLCVTCYQRGMKSILQHHGPRTGAHSHQYKCQECKSGINVFHKVHPGRVLSE